MILHDLFEGKMSELDIEYQDFLNKQGKHGMSDNEFQDAYGMSRTEWAKKNKEWTWQKERRPVAPDAHLFHEGAMKDLHTDLADKYRELAPKIEKYKDSYLAGQLYDALEAIAIEHNAELEFKRMLAGARNSAHMDYDTNPGGFQNWLWYLPFANEQLDELKFLGSECTKDCSGHRAGYNWSKRNGNVDGNSPWSPSFNKGAALAKAGK